jgi:hypothetical protein
VNLGTAADWTAAGAALLAAGLIAWQSFETRRSAAASERNTEVANRTLQLNGKLVVDGLKARIDADMPALTVLLESCEGLFKARRLEQERELVPAGTEFWLPKDAELYLVPRFRAFVYNDSSRHVAVTLHFTAPHEIEPVRKIVTLAPAEREAVVFEVRRTVRGWIDGDQSYTVGGASYYVTFSVGYEHPADCGANEGWNLLVDGSPIAPADERPQAYVLKEGNPVALRIFRHREYWLSKRRNEPLP